MGCGRPLGDAWDSLVAQKVKNLPAMRETWVPSLGGEDPLEKERQPIPVFLPVESHGRRSLVGYSPRGHKESGTTSLSLSLFPLIVAEPGIGSPGGQALPCWPRWRPLGLHHFL